MERMRFNFCFWKYKYIRGYPIANIQCQFWQWLNIFINYQLLNELKAYITMI